MTLASQTHLYLRPNGVYYFRRRVPPDLIQLYDNKPELNYSLKTKDKREAERLARLESVKADQQFSDQRKQLKQSQQVQVLSDEDISRLTLLFIHETLSDDDQRRMDSQLDDSYLEGLDVASSLFKESYAQASPSNVAYIVDHAL